MSATLKSRADATWKALSRSSLLKPILSWGGLAAMIVSFFIGAAFAVQDVFPASLVRNAKDMVVDLVFDEWVMTEQWTQNFIVDLVHVPVPPSDRPGEGGGMTEFGSETLLVTHDGRLFSLSEHDRLEALAISPPENGFSAYQALAARPEHSGRDFAPQSFRFNDILHYRTRTERALILSYSEYQADGECFTNTLAKLPVRDDIETALDIRADASDWQVLFRTKPCMVMADPPFDPWGFVQAGGRIDFKAPNSIILTSGDHLRDGIYAEESVSQDPDQDYGKVIEIDLTTGAGEILSVGHRNPQGIVVDRDGQIWSVEHGPRGGDELNLIQTGANFGWPLETFGTQYNELPIANTVSYGRHETFDAPIYSWVPSIGVSSLDQIQNFSPSWDGDLLAGSLRKNMLYRLRVRDGRVLFAEPILISGARIRYLLSHPSGKILLWAANQNQISILRPRADTYTNNTVKNLIAGMALDTAEQDTLMSALDGCQQCHAFDPNRNDLAPNLADVYGRGIGQTAFAAYSESLDRRDGKWTRETLEAFLLDPQAYTPGTTMPNSNLTEEEVALIVDLLQSIRETPAWAPE